MIEGMYRELFGTGSRCRGHYSFPFLVFRHKILSKTADIVVYTYCLFDYILELVQFVLPCTQKKFKKLNGWNPLGLQAYMIEL